MRFDELLLEEFMGQGVRCLTRRGRILGWGLSLCEAPEQETQAKQEGRQKVLACVRESCPRHKGGVVQKRPQREFWWRS